MLVFVSAVLYVIHLLGIPNFKIMFNFLSMQKIIAAKCYQCPNCAKTYKYSASLYNHVKYECGKEPGFMCSFCSYKTKRKHSLKDHLIAVHGVEPANFI
ncbi:unnamed protein product [Acanthoscelides obtectus]|uniref:C2H2-type domain-containing protein n=1 Tax=Acanthoscelides obtectus TaxID=200917 RepID=A0A9P0P2G0_ACAOB|nr:unnamed protein product [Acanthoscelides obtectus]CAK1669681.1 Longitudinals lacking protein, isoforms A/B/D/L [Acanthoscelides obtectus]